ncbi:flippase [Roseateles sp. BYS87W]|uniref:Flippase n=1 Tax=Pelomonas baiyunensis TaxID=3299026 RepID=A0ABW7H392_9BURK
MRLARHSIYNLLGMGLPLLLGVVAMPALVRLLGLERFGWLTLLWGLVSYLSLFDLGLPRVLTQSLAPALERRDWPESGRILGSAAVLVLALGVAVGGVLWLLAPWIAERLAAGAEAQRLMVAFRWMAWALPLSLLTTALRGALEACGAFRSLNLVRLPLGLWTFAGPWAVAEWVGPDLGWIAAALAAGRALALAAHLPLARRALRPVSGLWQWDGARALPMLKAGGWLTVGNLVSPLMGYADRFMLAVLLSGAAAGFYAAPQELVTKLWIIPGAVTGVLLPEFARQRHAGAGGWMLFRRATAAVGLVLLPFTLGLALFARELLGVWLGPEFAEHSGGVLMLFALGIQINGPAHVALTWLHAGGRYRAPAVLQVLQLPLFVLLVWAMATSWGLTGAACAWLIRMVFDTACLLALCSMEQRERPGWPMTLAGAGVAMLFGIALMEPSWVLRLAVWCLAGVGAVGAAWQMTRRGVFRARALEVQS